MKAKQSLKWQLKWKFVRKIYPLVIFPLLLFKKKKKTLIVKGI